MKIRRHLELACGPTRRSADVRSCAAPAHRGRGCPAGAHAVAVAAARRLHCAARSGVAPPNSPRSLRSLRSNNRGESVDEARWRAPTPALRCSSPPKSRPAGSPCREAHGCWCSLQIPPPFPQSGVRAGRSAPVERREAQGSWPRAQRASSSDSSRLFERSERSERSEFGDGPRDRAPQGSRCAAPTVSAKRCGLPAPAFAAPTLGQLDAMGASPSAPQSGPRTSPMGRKPSLCE
jgi:hypothetical protein